MTVERRSTRLISDEPEFSGSAIRGRTLYEGTTRLNTIRLLISCPDRRGIVATVAGFVADHNGNILEADQHSDAEHGEFFIRLEIEPEGFTLDEDSFDREWSPIASRFSMKWSASWPGHVKRAAILVSKQMHCLNDLLWRWKTGELRVEIPIVISNHEDARGIVEYSGSAFHHLPVTAETRQEQERAAVALLEQNHVDVVVLARYMQVLSDAVVARYPDRIINIHHSFLPAFAGGQPYRRAYDRGVKLIGATSHYVTADLDEGPIIAQSTLPVDHRDTVEDLVRKGRDLERMVLAHAVRLHVQDRILVTKNKTIVFD